MLDLLQIYYSVAATDLWWCGSCRTIRFWAALTMQCGNCPNLCFTPSRVCY